MKRKKIFLLLLYIAVMFTCFSLLKLLDLNPDGGDHSSERTQESTLADDSTEPPSSTPSDASAEEHTAEETNVEQEKEPVSFSYNRKESVVEESEQEPPKEEKKPSFLVASDLHYMDPGMTDYGEAYQAFVKTDDGKVLDYSSQLLGAFFDQVIRESPTALVLSGDLTLNGERVNHEGLAEKLRRVQQEGIQVLVIPGNHDINNPAASSFQGKERLPAETVTAAEFAEIYQEFGYGQAVSRDENSLSYLYELDEKNWLMMIDSCQYDPVNLVGGKIREETYPWMEDQLVRAREEQALVIPVSHHNLLEESRLYTFDCTLEQNKTFIGMLEWWRLPVYFSGHLHLQRVKKHKFEPGVPDEAYSITEIVSNSLAIAPCQYGAVTWTDEGELKYETRQVDVAAWAGEKEEADENLLAFGDYSREFLIEQTAGQIRKEMRSLPEEQVEEMSRLYGGLVYAYCAGIPIDRRQVESDPAYRLWQRNLPDSKMFREMEAVLKDTWDDHNSFQKSYVATGSELPD